MDGGGDVTGCVGGIADESGVVGLFASQVWPIERRKPKEMIVFVEMPGEEQIGAEKGRVGREIAQRNVQIPTTVLRGSLENIADDNE